MIIISGTKRCPCFVFNLSREVSSFLPLIWCSVGYLQFFSMLKWSLCRVWHCCFFLNTPFSFFLWKWMGNHWLSVVSWQDITHHWYQELQLLRSVFNQRCRHLQIVSSSKPVTVSLFAMCWDLLSSHFYFCTHTPQYFIAKPSSVLNY